MFNVILIETINQCNRKCSFCKFGIIESSPPKKILDMRFIKKIAKELGDLNYNGRISPFHINEPMLDKRLFDIISLFRQMVPRSYISIVSNGDLIDEEKLDLLFFKGLSCLGISIYDNNSFNKWQLLKHKYNITLIDMRVPRYLENRGGSIQGQDFTPCKLSCLRPSNMMVIDTNGEVVLCCADMFGEEIMGNIKTSKLIDIWNSSKFSTFRERLKSGDRSISDLCNNCSHVGTTSSISYPNVTYQETC